MYFAYGNFLHPPNEVLLLIEKSAVRSARGTTFAMQEKWKLMGRLLGNGQANINDQIGALQNAYGSAGNPNDGQDAGFYMDNGEPTNHLMISANTINGVRVIKPPEFPQGMPGEFSTFRNYEIELACEYNYPFQLLEWKEAISYRGDGSDEWILETSVNAQPIQTQLKQFTPVFIRERGTAKALGAPPYFAVPSPLFPAWYHGNETDIEPEATGDAYGSYEVKWSYSFSAPYAISPVMSPEPVRT